MSILKLAEQFQSLRMVAGRMELALQLLFGGALPAFLEAVQEPTQPGRPVGVAPAHVLHS